METSHLGARLVSPRVSQDSRLGFQKETEILAHGSNLHFARIPCLCTHKR